MTPATRQSILAQIAQLRRDKPLRWQGAVHRLCNALYEADHKGVDGPHIVPRHFRAHDSYARHLSRVPLHDRFDDNSHP